MSFRQTTDFLLYHWLQVESLQSRERFAEHNRETFDAVLDLCEKLAAEKFAPFNRIADTEEPWFDGEKVHLPESSHAAARAYAESGMLAAAQDQEVRGLVASVIVELTEELDDTVESCLRCQETRTVRSQTRAGELAEQIRTRYAWLGEFDFTDPAQVQKFWFSSANNEEPRRALAGVDPGESVQHAVDVARAVAALRDALAPSPAQADDVAEHGAAAADDAAGQSANGRHLVVEQQVLHGFRQDVSQSVACVL